MEIRDVTEKHRYFAADYVAGMDRAQLCAKYSIPDDKFESFLRYLMRNGILILNPPQPQPVLQEYDASSPPATPTPLATGQVAAIDSKLLDVGRRIISRYPRALMCYSMALSITIILILNGAPSLTGNLWKSKTAKKVLKSDDAKLYLNNHNAADVYVDLTADGHSFKYQVTRSYLNLPLDKSGHSIIRIEDQTKLRSCDLSLVSAHDVGPTQDQIKATKCYIESLNKKKGEDPFLYSPVQRIASLPDSTYYGTAKEVILELYNYEEITWKGYLLKGVKTVFTVNADIILIPLKWLVLFLFFAFSPRIT